MPAIAKQTAAPFVPRERKLTMLADAVQNCKGCDLYRNAT
jgi:DNA polymerase